LNEFILIEVLLHYTYFCHIFNYLSNLCLELFYGLLKCSYCYVLLLLTMPRRMRRAGRVARNGRGGEKCIQHLVIKSERKSPLIDLSVDGRIILKLILKR